MRHKDRLMDITLTAERYMESNSQVIEVMSLSHRDRQHDDGSS